MKNKKLSICTGLSFFLWLVPFILNLFASNNYNQNNDAQPNHKNEVVENIFFAYKANDKSEVFRLIFSNNIKVVAINIAGGIFLGIGTLVNLVQNGFYAGSIFSSLHSNGLSWSGIIIHTAPHSFEMIGILLSGGLGFYIALLLYSAIKKDYYPTSGDYKVIGIGILISFLLILVAAYVEAYISMS